MLSCQSGTETLSNEQLVKNHISHFLNFIIRKRKNKNKIANGSATQLTTAEDVSLDFLEVDDRISESILKYEKLSIKDKAYDDIQKSRGFNISTSYCAKQIDFLRLCEINFIKVLDRTGRKPGTNYVDTHSNNDEPSNEILIADDFHKILSYSTCNVFVSAIVDLWRY
ncbi:hypothetical protein K501DRAFT_272170 [Backusella circina FSU 941]|nr:hypothetical protein K501DRAFT_272170 [Backusella circina FSU 941]